MHFFNGFAELGKHTMSFEITKWVVENDGLLYHDKLRARCVWDWQMSLFDQSGRWYNKISELFIVCIVFT